MKCSKTGGILSSQARDLINPRIEQYFDALNAGVLTQLMQSIVYVVVKSLTWTKKLLRKKNND